MSWINTIPYDASCRRETHLILMTGGIPRYLANLDSICRGKT